MATTNEKTTAEPLLSAQAMADAGILIVDDEPANVRRLAQILALDGYRNVIGITDPRQIKELLAEQGTDLLLDMNMPYLGHVFQTHLRPSQPTVHMCKRVHVDNMGLVC